MTECKYSVVRYFADPVRVEPVNIGLVMHSAQEQFLASDFDLRRVASKISKSDKETVKYFSQELESIENHDVEWEHARFETIPVADTKFLQKAADYIGNKIVFDLPRGCITPDPDQLFEELFQRFVATKPRHLARVTKRTVVREVREVFQGRGWGEYVKARPTVLGEHKNYTLPLGIRHAHRSYVEVLKMGEAEEKNYRAMAAVGRLWQDARKVPGNRQADLCVVVRYENDRLREGERLLQEDDIRVFLNPRDVLGAVNVEQVRMWV
jgi:hypothetical protein